MTKHPDAISQRGIDLIKKFEGLRLQSYQDEGGVWTIGYGHTKGVKRGQTITEAEALAFLEVDMAEALRGIDLYVKVPLSQYQYDALASWTFNLGVGNLRSSTLLKKLNAGDYSAIPEQIVRWNKVKVKGRFKVSKGLVRRRTAEAALWSMDAAFAADGGEAMVQKPRAVDEDTKPLKKSRTLWGLGASTVGVIGTVASEVAKDLEPLAASVPSIQYVALALTVLGIVSAGFARIDDHLKKVR